MSKASKFTISTLALLTLTMLSGCDDILPRYVFDMTRLSTDGGIYKGNNNYLEQPWACARDNKSGFTWEVKTATPGLHASTNTYTWYNHNEKPDGTFEGKQDGGMGKQNGGICTGSSCDTEAFVAAVNAERLCGFSDWRLPSKDELGSIVDATVSIPGPTVPKELPNIQNAKSGYWTSTNFRMLNSSAWVWRFDHGADLVSEKSEPRYVILVRGTAKTAEDQKPAQK